MTVMGDALRDRLSDRGSIPLRSTENVPTLFWSAALAALYFRAMESRFRETLSIA